MYTARLRISLLEIVVMGDQEIRILSVSQYELRCIRNVRCVCGTLLRLLRALRWMLFFDRFIWLQKIDIFFTFSLTYKIVTYSALRVYITHMAVLLILLTNLFS